MLNEAVIASAVRTATGSFLGALKNVSAPELGAVATRAAIERTGITADQVDEVIMGNVLCARHSRKTAVSQQAMRPASMMGGGSCGHVKSESGRARPLAACNGCGEW